MDSNEIKICKWWGCMDFVGFVSCHHASFATVTSSLKQVALAIECSDFRSPARRRCATEKKGSGSSLDPIRQLGYAGIIIPNIWKSEIMFRTTNWTNQFSMILWSETLSMDHRLNDPQIWFAAMISGETAHLSCMDHTLKDTRFSASDLSYQPKTNKKCQIYWYALLIMDILEVPRYMVNLRYLSPPKKT